MAETRPRRPAGNGSALGDVLTTGENPVIEAAEAQGFPAIPCGVDVVRLRDNPNGPFIYIGNQWITMAEANRLRIDLGVTVDMVTARAALANPKGSPSTQ